MGRKVGWALFVGVVLYVMSTRIRPVQHEVTTSFAGYWVVARAWTSGVDVVSLYDDGVLMGEMARHGISLPEKLIGPPSLVLTLVPLAGFDYETARRIWLWLVLLPPTVGSLVWASARVRAGPWIAMAFLLSPAVAQGFEFGQVYPLILLCHLVVWRYLDRPMEFGLGVTPLAVSRGWPAAVLCLVPLVRGDLRGLGAAVAMGTLGVLATVPLVGWEAWVHFFTIQLPQGVDPEVRGVVAYQSWPSLVAHLTQEHPVWGPNPPLPGVAGVPLAALGLLVAGFGLFSLRRTPDRLLGFAVCLELGLSPFTQEYHLILLVIPVVVLAKHGHWGVVLMVLGLGCLPFRYDVPELLGGWRSLLAYPRLWGVVVAGGGLVFPEVLRQLLERGDGGSGHRNEL